MVDRATPYGSRRPRPKHRLNGLATARSARLVSHRCITRRRSPFLALLRHADGMRGCLFIETERKWAARGQTGANDPRRTLRLTLARSALVRTIERDASRHLRSSRIESVSRSAAKC
jgi:hypothetical protein